MAVGQPRRTSKQTNGLRVCHVFPKSGRGASRDGFIQAATDILYDKFLEFESELSAKEGSRR